MATQSAPKSLWAWAITTRPRKAQSGGYISQSDFRLHFGLGKATKADEVEIRWPSGIVRHLSHVAGGRYVRIDEPVAQIN